MRSYRSCRPDMADNGHRAKVQVNKWFGEKMIWVIPLALCLCDAAIQAVRRSWKNILLNSKTQISGHPRFSRCSLFYRF